jgi:hypothetical protein
MGKKQTLANFNKHELTGVVMILEYIIRPAQSFVKSNTEAGRRGKDTTAENFIVVVGSQVYVPYDGKRLRLRNIPKVSDRNPNKVSLALFADQRCRIFSNDHVYNPYEMEDDEEEETKLISFELKCTDKKGKEIRDETPLVDDDESDDDADVSDAETEKSWVSDSEKSVSTKFSSSDEESDKESESESEGESVEKPKKKVRTANKK